MTSKFYESYLNVEDWKILDEKECHFFNDDETPFTAVLVEIGALTVLKTAFKGTKVETLPITRWITKCEYETFKKNSGAVVF